MSASAKPVSNWSKLKNKVSKPKVKEDEEKKTLEEVKPAKLSAKLKANYVGLDCEMVGIGPDGTQSALARCCLVDYDGEVIYDEFVRPPGFVTDFRTKWSGVRKKDLRQGTAISLQECQTAVANILKDKVLVGHALRNDLDVLMLSHPRTMIRDTATFRPYMRIHGKHGKMRPRALKDLTKEHLHMEIQTGEHDPGVDARCAMFLYQKKREEWEAHLKDTKNAARQRATLAAEEHKQQALAEEAALKAARLLSKPGRSVNTGNNESNDQEGQEGAPVRRAPKETTLHTQEKKEKTKKSKGGVTTYKDGGVGKSVSMDVEVQVLGGEDESEASDNNDSDNEGVPSARSSATLSVTKKRKISKNGFITSNSTKHHRTVDGRLEATKRAKIETEQQALGAKNGGARANAGGMFGSVFGLDSGVNGGDAVNGGAGGKKLKSIAEVDRAMKSAHSKANKKA